MSDIWSGIGVDIKQDEGEWLYRVGAEVRGPLAHRLLVEKLLRGDIALDTMVAREGTQFYELGQVQAFAPYLAKAEQLRDQRQAAERRKHMLLILVPVVVLLVGVGCYMYHLYHVRLQQQRERERQQRIELANKPPPPLAPHLGLVALVSLGSESDVMIHHNAPHGKRRGHLGGGRPHGEEDENEEVQSCKLTQQEIFGTLRASLGKINVCVEDERKRDTQNWLPQSLELEFVVRPSGKVAEFAVTDRHYRTGPMNNCLIKAFNTIIFPSSSGANCPVTIPIKIGK